MFFSIQYQYSRANNPVKEKQNVIIFLVDDMGWMDSAVYGSEYYETPNIDRLAEMGMRFTQAYAANPLCSPTRAAILTGRYPSRFELTSASAHLPANPGVDLTPKKKKEPWRKMSPPLIRHFMPLKEQINLAAFYPEVVKELDGLIEKHLQEVECFRPVKNEAYNPKVNNPKIGLLRNQKPRIE